MTFWLINGYRTSKQVYGYVLDKVKLFQEYLSKCVVYKDKHNNTYHNILITNELIMAITTRCIVNIIQNKEHEKLKIYRVIAEMVVEAQNSMKVYQTFSYKAFDDTFSSEENAIKRAKALAKDSKYYVRVIEIEINKNGVINEEIILKENESISNSKRDYSII